MNKYREIGAAGCCGAVAGTAVAIVCDWSILMLLPAALIGAVTAFVCYSPHEVVSVIGAFGCDMGGAMRRWMQKPWRIPHIAWHEAMAAGEALLVATRYVAIGVACVTLVCISLLSVPSLIVITGIALPFPDQKAVWGPIIFWAVMFSSVGYAGLMSCLPALEAVRRGSWYLPLTQRAKKIIWQPWDDEGRLTMKRALLYSGAFPLYMQVIGTSLGVLVICDIVLTVALACASTERIAAVLGATLGFCAGIALHFCGVPGSLAGSLVILATSGAVGWFAGPCLYRLRAYLAREPAVETVRS